MGWRTSQVPREALLTEKLALPALLEAIEKKNSAAALTSLNSMMAPSRATPKTPQK
jgi:hypothetical protein